MEMVIRAKITKGTITTDVEAAGRLRARRTSPAETLSLRCAGREEPATGGLRFSDPQRPKKQQRRQAWQRSLLFGHRNPHEAD